MKIISLDYYCVTIQGAGVYFRHSSTSIRNWVKLYPRTTRYNAELICLPLTIETLILHATFSYITGAE